MFVVHPVSIKNRTGLPLSFPDRKWLKRYGFHSSTTVAVATGTDFSIPGVDDYSACLAPPIKVNWVWDSPISWFVCLVSSTVCTGAGSPSGWEVVEYEGRRLLLFLVFLCWSSLVGVDQGSSTNPVSGVKELARVSAVVSPRTWVGGQLCLGVSHGPWVSHWSPCSLFGAWVAPLQPVGPSTAVGCIHFPSVCEGVWGIF